MGNILTSHAEDLQILNVGGPPPSQGGRADSQLLWCGLHSKFLLERSVWKKLHSGETSRIPSTVFKSCALDMLQMALSLRGLF